MNKNSILCTLTKSKENSDSIINSYSLLLNNTLVFVHLSSKFLLTLLLYLTCQPCRQFNFHPIVIHFIFIYFSSYRGAKSLVFGKIPSVWRTLGIYSKYLTNTRNLFPYNWVLRDSSLYLVFHFLGKDMYVQMNTLHQSTNFSQ